MKKIFLILLISVSIGCGGGSAGTGGQRFDGEIVTRDGTPVPNATVTLTNTGDSAVSDANGKYSIDTDSLSGTVTIEVALDNSTATTQVNDIPEDASEIEVRIEFDKDREEAKPTKVEIKRRNNQSSSSSSSSSNNSGGGSSSEGSSSSANSSNSSDDDSDSSSSSSDDDDDDDLSSSSDGSSSSSVHSSVGSSSSDDDDDDDDDDNSGSGGHGRSIKTTMNIEDK